MSLNFMHFDEDGNLLVAPTTDIIVAPLVVVTDSITLPGVGGTYAVADEVSDNAVAGSAVPFQFVDVVQAVGDTGYIVKAVLHLSIATGGNFRLWLFNAAPTMFGNDAAYQLDAEDKAKRVGYIDFALVTEGAGSDAAYAFDGGLRLAFKCGAASKDLWGILVAKSAYVWGAAEVIDAYLTVELA